MYLEIKSQLRPLSWIKYLKRDKLSFLRLEPRTSTVTHINTWLVRYKDLVIQIVTIEGYKIRQIPKK